MPECEWLYPEAAALALPLLVAWWFLARERRGAWWRLMVLVLVVVAAMGPELAWQRGGSDVVFIFDRSQSMVTSTEAFNSQQEKAAIAGEQRHAGDRLGVVVVGDGAFTLQAPNGRAIPRLADGDVRETATDLHAGLELAAGLIAPERTGRVVIHSDGEATGLDPRRPASELALRGIPVDVLTVASQPFADAAIMRIEIPGELRLGESFIGTVTFFSDATAPEVRGYSIKREVPGGKPAIVAEGHVELLPGEELPISFADRPPKPGLSTYLVELDTKRSVPKVMVNGPTPAEPSYVQLAEEADRLPLNNTGRAALNVMGGERILVMGGDGRPGNIAHALEAAGLQVDVVPEGRIGLDQLLAYQVLVLEQVPADKLSSEGLSAIANWVEHLGGGLVMTGGRRSFGSGGYHKSAVERVLPVTMELRDEHRKLSVAMAIVLDRSGSMAAPVAGGQTKMDLANEGTASVIELLSPLDEVAVFAVDSAPHEVVPLQAVSDPGGLADKARRIESMGGGIYVYEGLVAGGEQLLQSSKGTRHLVLFADAADAEHPADYKNLLAAYREQGITVSVIGLGTEADVDAPFLKDVAERGGGRISFSTAAEELPRLFAQETVLVARSSWVDSVISPEVQPTLPTVLGQSQELTRPWPAVIGYNLVYSRPEAEVLALNKGEYEGPGIATWNIGTGRSAAVTFNLDDPNNESFLGWDGYVACVGGLVRWCAGSGDQDVGALLAERAGRSVRVRLELDPLQRERWPDRIPHLRLVGEDGQVHGSAQVAMEAIDEGVFESIVALDSDRAVVPSVALQVAGDAQAIFGPALQLPYSPEAEPRLHQKPGAQLLEELAKLTGGQERGDLLGLYDNPPSPGKLAPIAVLLIALASVLFVAEVAIRRLRLRFGLPKRGTRLQAGDGKRVKQVQREEQAVPVPPSEPSTAGKEADSGPDRDQGLHEALRQMKKRRGR